MCVFSFPSGKYLGWIEYYAEAGLYQNLCADEHGAVFVVAVAFDSYPSSVLRVTGGGPSNVLHDDNQEAAGCAVDPVTGDLALANTAQGQYRGTVAAFTHAQGKARFFHAPNSFSYTFCSYDSAGDLYVIGND
jgi:hypothetical protein